MNSNQVLNGKHAVVFCHNLEYEDHTMMYRFDVT